MIEQVFTAGERIEAEVIEDDRTGDHCVLKLVDMRNPHTEALLYYENRRLRTIFSTPPPTCSTDIPSQRFAGYAKSTREPFADVSLLQRFLQ